MFKYQYTLKTNDGSTTLKCVGHAVNLQQMLAKIENEKNLDECRITEIKEVRR